MDEPIATIPFAPDGGWPGVTGFCTTRRAGVSAPPYDTFNLGMHAGEPESCVSVNRARLRLLLPSEPLWLRQVHGTAVHDADRALDGATLGESDRAAALPRTVPQADACVTTRPGQVLAILTADCLPVVIAGIDGGVLGMAHAGWRGLASGVLEATLLLMRAKAPRVDALRAWIGPGIGPAHFEVGSDVLDAFAGQGNGQGQDNGNGSAGRPLFSPIAGRSGKWLADLPRLAALRLRAAGVGDVRQCGRCTVSEPDVFYSYRRDGQTGRMATLAWLDGG